MSVQTDYTTALGNILSTATGASTPYGQTKAYVEEQITKYNLTGRDAAQLMTSLMGNMSINITNSAIAAALSVALGEQQNNYTIAQIATEVSKQNSYAADVAYKTVQKDSLTQTVADNKTIKSLEAIANMILGVSSGGLVPPTKLFTAFVTLINGLNTEDFSVVETDYTVSSSS